MPLAVMNVGLTGSIAKERQFRVMAAGPTGQQFAAQ